MTEKLDFNIPQRYTNPSPRVSKIGIMIDILILLLVSGILLILLAHFRKEPHIRNAAFLSDASQKELALKLEQQGLQESAASAWIEYLTVADMLTEDIARIWFRIGKLCQDAHQYEQALDAYYRSEYFAKIDEISSEISRRVQESLESMEKFATLRDELSSRVCMKDQTSKDANNTDRDTVVAEISLQKITLSDLDHRIEKEIDRQLSMIAPDMTDEAKNKQKETLLRQFATTTQRERMLNQYLAEEIARTSKISEDPEVQDEIQNQERAMLAKKVIQKACSELIKITPGDLATYYDAHKDDYQKPYADVQHEVYAALRAQKEQEVRVCLLS